MGRRNEHTGSNKVKDTSHTTVEDNNNFANCRALENSVPIYHGQNSGNPSLWLKKFNRYANLRKWTDSTKCVSLALFLDNAAAEWFDSLDADSFKDNFSSLSDSFLKEFSLTKAQELSKLSFLITRKQSPTETVEDYFLNVAKRCRELTRTPQQHFEIIVQGLLPHIQQQVLLQEPSTVAEVKRIALLVESVQQSPTSTPTASTSSLPVEVNSVSYDLTQIREQLRAQADQVAELTSQLRHERHRDQSHRPDKRRLHNRHDDKFYTRRCHERYGQDSRRSNRLAKQDDKMFNCRRCGEHHGPRSCPAYGQKCRKCSRFGHFAKVCRAKLNNNK